MKNCFVIFDFEIGVCSKLKLEFVVNINLSLLLIGYLLKYKLKFIIDCSSLNEIEVYY